MRPRSFHNAGRFVILPPVVSAPFMSLPRIQFPNRKLRMITSAIPSVRWLAAMGLLWGALCNPCPALDVEGKPQWGFDGKARLGQFNLLTVEIANNAEEPWEGNLELEAKAGIGRADIPILHPNLFIEPYGRRRIQFFVFLPEISEYRLKWGRGPDDRFEIDEPGLSDQPARIRLDRGSLTTTKLKLPAFDGTAFPTSAAGLGGLGTVVLDHVPRWSDAQRQAFKDWLFAGGTVHLYQSDGEFPEFPGVLSELNEPSDRIRTGSGFVYRHSERLTDGRLQAARDSQDRYPEWQVSTELFTLLKQMTQPEHNWPLIYLMAALYLLLLFPGCWLVGRRKGDFRVTYGVLLGVVCLFSVGFHTVGRRGYGETTSVNSIAIARPGADDRWIVDQWSNVFITGGGQYAIQHQAEGLVYSTGQVHESVLGRALNRPQGVMLTDIPSFSSRTVVHTGVLKLPSLTPEIQEFETNEGRLRSAVFTLPKRPDWPSEGRARAILLWKNRFHHASVVGGPDPVTIRFGASSSSLNQVIDRSQWMTNRYAWDQQTFPTDQLYDRTLGLLIATDLNLKSDGARDQYSLPEDELRLWVFAEMPDEFHAQGEISEQQSGRVLYSFRLSVDERDLPESADTEDI